MSNIANNDPTQGRDSLSKLLRRNLSLRRIGLLMRKGWNVLHKRGVRAVFHEMGYRFRLATHSETWKDYADFPSNKELKKQRKAKFNNMPLISVIVPLYNTPEAFLREMIDSVLHQSYANWELVLVDASSTNKVSAIAAAYQQKDERVLLNRISSNEGIAGNTNIGIAESKGDYIVLFDHDDKLAQNALYEVVKVINETDAELIYSDEAVMNSKMTEVHKFHFKPDYGPDTLRGCNYITHLCVFSRALMERAGGAEDSRYDGAQDYDLILRLSEKAEYVHHIPKVLYFWRSHEGSTAKDIAQKPEAINAGREAIAAHLEREHLEGKAFALTDYPGAYGVKYDVLGTPLVSVLIPNKDHIDDLKRCLDSLYLKAGWEQMEVLVLDNNSEDIATESFYEEAEQTYTNLRVLRYTGVFNFAAIANFGVARAKGEHVLLLNNDMEILSDGFIYELLSYSQRMDVGAVGAKLYYPDDTIQHAGLFIGIGGTAGVSHKGHKRSDGGNMFRLCTTQNMSAVTGAALMVKKSIYEAVQGMDEERFGVAFNDVDLCLKIRASGLWNVYTPFAEAYHFESKSRGYDTEGPAKERFDKEAKAFREKYADIMRDGDPFYNRHLTLKNESYGWGSYLNY